MNRVRSRGTISALGSFACAFLSSSVLVAAAPEPEPRDQALSVLGPRLTRTDFVVLIDMSASMAKQFDAIKIFTADLSKRARPDDTLSVVTFHERAGVLPMMTLRGQSPETVRARLAQLRPPMGELSDLGAGLDAALEVLVRLGHAPLAMVFVISDFCARPSSMSPYLGELDGAGPCRRVAIPERVIQKSKEAGVGGGAPGDRAVRAVAIALEPANDLGIQAVRDVLGAVVRLDVAKNDLLGALQGLQKKLAYDRAQLLVEQLLRRPPLHLGFDKEELPLEGEASLQLTLLGASPLPMSFTLVGMRAIDDSVRFELTGAPHPIELPSAKPPAPKTGEVAWEPIEGATFEVKAKNLPRRAPPWSPSNPKREVEVELLLRYAFSPTEPLEKLIGRPPTSDAPLRERRTFTFVLPAAAGPPALSIVAQPPERELTLGAGASAEVPIVLTSSIAWAKVAARCTIGGKDQGVVQLEPGSSVSLTTIVTNEAAAAPWRLRSSERREIRVTGTCDVVAIGADGTEIPRGRVALSAPLMIAWREGISPLLVAGVLLAILASLLVYIREVKPRLAPPSLSGQLVIYDGPGEFTRLVMPLEGHARIQLQGVPRGDAAQPRIDGDRIVLPGTEGTSAEVYAEKLGKESVMRLKRLQGERVMFGGSRIGAAPVDVKRGKTRFSVGDYHCRIE